MNERKAYFDKILKSWVSKLDLTEADKRRPHKASFVLQLLDIDGRIANEKQYEEVKGLATIYLNEMVQNNTFKVDVVVNSCCQGCFLASGSMIVVGAAAIYGVTHLAQCVEFVVDTLGSTVVYQCKSD